MHSLRYLPFIPKTQDRYRNIERNIKNFNLYTDILCLGYKMDSRIKIEEPNKKLDNKTKTENIFWNLGSTKDNRQNKFLD